MKERVQFSKENWSGESDTLTYDPEKMTFELKCLEGYRFRLESKPNTKFEFIIRGNAWESDYSLGDVFMIGKTWTAMQYDLNRSDDNMFIAAAKLLCNTI